MRLFGYELKLTIRRIHKDPVVELRKRMLSQAEELTKTWEETRKRKMWLNLWIDWPTKTITVTKLQSERVLTAEA